MKNRQDLIVARFSFENVFKFSREAGSGGESSGALSDGAALAVSVRFGAYDLDFSLLSWSLESGGWASGCGSCSDRILSFWTDSRALAVVLLNSRGSHSWRNVRLSLWRNVCLSLWRDFSSFRGLVSIFHFFLHAKSAGWTSWSRSSFISGWS